MKSISIFLLLNFLYLPIAHSKWVGQLETEQGQMVFEPVQWDQNTVVFHQVESRMKILKTVNDKTEIIQENEVPGSANTLGHSILEIRNGTNNILDVHVNMVTFKNGIEQTLNYTTQAYFQSGTWQDFINGLPVVIELTPKGIETTSFALTEYLKSLLESEAKKRAIFFNPKVEILDFNLLKADLSGTISNLIQNIKNIISFRIKL